MRLETVARFDSPAQARLAEALLRDAGIPCRVAGEGEHALTPFFTPRRGAVRLEVPETFAEEARAVLAAADDEAA